MKILVAYSGGLDTSVMVHWLKKKYDAEIITFTGNLGQKSELVNIENKAKMTGASKSYVCNLAEEFINQYVYKVLKSGALYENKYPMATAIGRPLLAKKMVEIAIEENVDAVAHGCTGKGNDQVRFEMGIKTLAPGLEILAPLRTWEFKSREAEIIYAMENNIPLSITKDKPYSIDENLWGMAIECGELEDETLPPPNDIYQLTLDIDKTPDTADYVKITFEKGVPVKINDIKLSPVDLVNYLNELGGQHGIGRIDMIENRVIGIKSREVYEAPAATILHAAHYELEKLVLDKMTFNYKLELSNKIANLVYEGMWFTPLFNSLMQFVDSTQENVSGDIKLKLLKGNCIVESRSSQYSLYNKELATYSEADKFNHKDSEGFINLMALPYSTQTVVQKMNEKLNAVG